MTSTAAPDPRRFEGLTMAEAIAQVIAEGHDEAAAEADAWAADADDWYGENR